MLIEVLIRKLEKVKSSVNLNTSTPGSLSRTVLDVSVHKLDISSSLYPYGSSLVKGNIILKSTSTYEHCAVSGVDSTTTGSCIIVVGKIGVVDFGLSPRIGTLKVDGRTIGSCLILSEGAVANLHVALCVDSGSLIDSCVSSYDGVVNLECALSIVDECPLVILNDTISNLQDRLESIHQSEGNRGLICVAGEYEVLDSNMSVGLGYEQCW